jgi:signal transduction histidine kinase
MRLQGRVAWARLGLPVVDAAVAAGLFLIMALTIATKVPENGQRGGDVLAYVLATVLSLPFAVHRRVPMSALAATLVGFLAFAALDYAAYPGFGLFAILYGVALHADRRRSLIALAAALTCMIVGLLLQPDNVVTASDTTSSLLAVAVAWLVGDNLRGRRARWRALHERNERLELERESRDRQAVADERLRIARELHDVVAHSMSVIAIQAAVGHHLIDTDPAEARRALGVVETTSRAALTEMRLLLGVLRSPDGDGDVAGRTPTAGLAGLTSLVARVRDAGLGVALTVEGSLDDLPAAVDLSAYRLVQEALTNVMKHGGPVATVAVRRTASEIDVEVTDDGRAGVEAGRPETAAHPGGQGLIGMRERVSVFSGEFVAGRRPGGGFRVAARLPLGPPLMAAVEGAGS